MSDRTLDLYLAHVRLLGEYFGKDPVSLSEEQVRAYFLYLRTEKKYHDSTMNQAKVAIRTFYHGHLKISPVWPLFEEVKVRRKRDLPTVISREEVRLLLGCVDDQKYHTILTVIYSCGLRINEACKLEVTDIDTDAQRVLVRHGKGGKSRYVPIAPEVIDLMREWYKVHRNQRFIFPAVGRKWKTTARATRKQQFEQQRVAMHTAKVPMSASAVRNALRYALAASGLKQPITLHTLRHCYATHLLEDGVSIRHISAYLGHASLNQTLVYAHLTTTGEAHTRKTLHGLFESVIAPTKPDPQ